MRGARLLPLAVALAVGACVEIATGPGGVASIRLLPVPPSIILGDTLRDSTGAAVRLRAVAFNERGDTIGDVPFRFTALALPRDTSAAQREIPIVVDSVTGVVRAVATTVATRARIAARVGDRLQVLDTIALVKRPTRFARDSAADTLRFAFLCNDTGRVSSQVVAQRLSRSDTALLGNAFPLSANLTADSTGTLRAPVPSYYVRFDLLSPAGIPEVRRAGGPARPAISIIADPSSDRATNTDTTDAAGTVTAYLRVLPEGLPPTGAFADSIITVTVRATARTSPTKIVPDSALFVVRLRRLTAGFPQDTTSFRRDPLSGAGCGR